MRHTGNRIGGTNPSLSANRRFANLMKSEYDFSEGERWKFYPPGAVLNPPVHLDSEVRAFLTVRAQARGVSLSDLVNTLLKKDIELIETAE
jgi:hypothetical protein